MFVRVKFCDFVCPSTTLPKAKLAGVMLNPGCTPVPVTGTVNGELLALLVTVTLPDALPAVVGANTTLRIALAAAFTIMGVVIPFTANPVPVAAMFVIWTATVPVLVNVMCCVVLLPVLTLPKLTEVGLACNCPNGAVDPVPANATLVVGLTGSLLVMDKLPAAAPPTLG